MSELDNVRVDLSFDDPDTEVPTWVDVTTRAIMRAGATITRGRTDEITNAPPGSLTLSFKNDDGFLSPGLGLGPWNVRCMNRIRVSYRDPLVPANILDAASANFEAGTVGGWSGSGGTTVGNSVVRAFSGTRSLLVTWPTAAANAVSATWSTTAQLRVGRSYTVRARVWVPVGSPAVRVAFVNNFFAFYGSPSTTTGAWELITASLTPTKPETIIVIRANAGSTAGQQVWVDEVRIDETVGPATFTTNPLYGTGGVSVDRFDGYVEEWPGEWPSGGQNEHVSTVTCYDLKGRVNRAATLRSVIEETYALSSPSIHMPLNEDDPDTTTVGDRTGSEAVLTVTDVGTGAAAANEDTAVIFGGGTGPATDGGRAVRFAPSSTSNGAILAGQIPRQGLGVLTSGYTYALTFRSATLAVQTVARFTDAYGTYLDIGVSATGKLTMTFYDTWSGGVTSTYTSASTFANNATHAVHVTIEYGSNIDKVLTLYVNGVALGGFTIASWVFLPDLGAGALTIGGIDTGRLLTGTVAHIGVFRTALDPADIFEQAASVRTGFNNERTDQRIARIASWLGIGAAFLNLDTGNARVGHVDCSGMNAGEYMDLVTTTEAGNLFAGTDGRLTFHNRARAYTVGAAVDIAIPAETIEPGTKLTNSITGVINDVTVSRTNGATVHLEDPASKLANGEASASVTVASSTDADALARAQWMLATRANPMTRLPELGMDGLTEPTSSPSIRTVDINDRVSIAGAPLQMPASVTDLRVQGYREVISTDGWDITANTTPYVLLRPLIADDPVYGLADADNRAVY